MKRYYGPAEGVMHCVEWNDQLQILTITSPHGTIVTASERDDGITPTVVNIFQKG